EEGERAQVRGSWVEDRRYGRQVKVEQALPLAPSEEAAVLAYVRRLPGVGERRARRVLERFGVEEAIAAVDRDPQGALRAAGLGAGAAARAAEAWERLRVTRHLYLLLVPHGLGHLVPAIHDAFGDRAHRVISERPYSLTRVFGVGFALADRIARGLGTPVDGAERCRAGIVHLLREAERAGSTCLAQTALEAALEELLGGAPAPGALAALLESGEVVCDDGWLSRRETAELEGELADRVAALVGSPPRGRLRDASAPKDADSGTPDSLTAEQQAAVTGALRSRLSLVTGGPGTGKTATIRAIAGAAARHGARVLLVAPTGRAATRMSEATGLSATTVHSALAWIPGQGPARDEHDPLGCDLLIVDETSMASLEVLVALLRAVPAHASVVLVGDADQLAPVGAGKPFAELVGRGLVPVTRLTHIFRQAAGSMIVQGAHAVRQGRAPELAPREGMRRDLFMIERSDPLAARAEVVSLVAERLPAHFDVDPVREIQVFAPVYRGELGIDALNRALREVLNPGGAPVRGGRLRIGDKVMMTGRNLHELGLMNGTVLTLLDEVSGEADDAALLLAGEEGVFRLPAGESDRLALAYACSVHRGQGIELPVAVIVAHPAAGAYFLRREMLYTALTRARLATVIVGAREALARAARTPDTERRHTRLSAHLTRAISSAVRAQSV
ncbi:MAG TPA: AAA family ATPase, partial [Solirubrobacteraceae bacterium]|nr:AAA family ATPase [Solirubrobacteraceae bacterium]